MIKKLVLLTSIVLCIPLSLYAHDFEVDGIYYNIIDSESYAVEVTHKGEDYNSFDNEYTGRIIIPSSVIYNNTEYQVIAVGTSAFERCIDVTDVNLPNNILSIKEDAF